MKHEYLWEKSLAGAYVKKKGSLICGKSHKCKVRCVEWCHIDGMSTLIVKLFNLNKNTYHFFDSATFEGLFEEMKE